MPLYYNNKGQVLSSLLAFGVISTILMVTTSRMILFSGKSIRGLTSNLDLNEIGILFHLLTDKQSSCQTSGLVGVDVSNALATTPLPVPISLGTNGNDQIVAGAVFGGTRRIESVTLTSVIPNGDPDNYISTIAVTTKIVGAAVTMRNPQLVFNLNLILDSNNLIISCYGVTSTSPLPYPSPSTVPSPILSLDAFCSDIGGTWDALTQKCSNVKQALCIELGGTYNATTKTCSNTAQMLCNQMGGVYNATSRTCSNPIQALCTQMGGTYTAATKICSNISLAICNQMGGVYNATNRTCSNPIQALCTQLGGTYNATTKVCTPPPPPATGKSIATCITGQSGGCNCPGTLVSQINTSNGWCKAVSESGECSASGSPGSINAPYYYGSCCVCR